MQFLDRVLIFHQGEVATGRLADLHAGFWVGRRHRQLHASEPGVAAICSASEWHHVQSSRRWQAEPTGYRCSLFKSRCQLRNQLLLLQESRDLANQPYQRIIEARERKVGICTAGHISLVSVYPAVPGRGGPSSGTLCLQ